MSTAAAAVTSWAPPARPPRTLDEFLACFPDDAACRRYLAQVAVSLAFKPKRAVAEVTQTRGQRER
jgi:hypothetical protein